MTDPSPHLAGFWDRWGALGFWPAGPVWFLWVLLLFDGLAAALYAIRPEFGHALGRLSGSLACRPVVYALGLLGTSSLAYVPLAMVVTAGTWWRAGPSAKCGRSVWYFSSHAAITRKASSRLVNR